MDVQTEGTDPPPCETQSSGKIRKGFKLFGKRKPGNIFSIRNKGDGNNKSPVKTGKSLDGLSETATPDSEQESDKEKRHEVSQGEREQAEEEPLNEDGVLAAAPARTSISSASSARSLSFLSLLRGGRRGVGDHRAHTVSQPMGRQRRGLKGLFGNVKFLSKDKEDKEESPPSPLLMSSRANSVEIIKEDLTLTPKSQPRSLGSPVTEPIRGVTTQDSAATSPSDVSPQATPSNVSSTHEHVPPLPDSEPPMEPGDSSLSSLLADISSLLTFDSISGGDILADVEAEWGKASSAISAEVTEVTSSSTYLFSKPFISSPLTSTSVSTTDKAKPSPVASTQSSTPLTKTSSTSSPIAKPSSIITTLTKSSTLTTHSVKLSSDSAPVSTSTTPVTLTSFSVPKMSSPSVTAKSTLSTTSTTTTAPPNTPATVVKASSFSPTLTSTISKLAPETAPPPQVTSSVSKPSPVATPAPVKPPVTHSPPTPVTIIQHPPIRTDSSGSSALHASTSYKPFLSTFAVESKAPAAESLAGTVTAKPSSPAPVFPTKTTSVPTSTATSSTVFSALSKPQLMSSPMEINRMTPSLAAVPDLPSTFTCTTKTQPSPASMSLSSTSSDKVPPAYKPPPTPVYLEKVPPAPTTTPAPVAHPGVSPPALGQTPLAQSKGPYVPVQVIGSKDLPAPAPMHVSQARDPPPIAPIPVSVSKELPVPVTAQITQSKVPSAQAQIPVSVSKDAPVKAPAQIPVSVMRDLPAPASAPISVSKDAPVQAHTQIPVSVMRDIPAPACVPISVSKDAPVKAHAQIPVSVVRDLPAPASVPISVSKDAPAPIQGFVSKDAPAQIQLSQSKVPSAPSPSPCPVSSSSLSSPPSSWQSEALASAKTRGSAQASVDGKLSSPSSTETLSAQTAPDKPAEQHNESRADLPRERKIPQAKPSGLSKIPVVGGGRAGRIPVRDSQHTDDEASRDPPTPVLEEERPNFYSHDAGSRDKIRDVEVNVPTSKHSQEESQQQKVLTSLPRDSRIPVKHGASQIPQAKEPQRTKIPVSKVPVRRAGTKPAASGGSAQMRK
ncbi:APC membrane recruitment protein 2 [Notolabrus celidotus]|uniref:APC membrane recruitment protein 2 n=1 Tax=Notolabrus celidotus TaxID=1203425 RepID=UPI00148FBEEA|nr:APC membrane recruitment protein 2 [Notolabrus celidotus]